MSWSYKHVNHGRLEFKISPVQPHHGWYTSGQTRLIIGPNLINVQKPIHVVFEREGENV